MYVMNGEALAHQGTVEGIDPGGRTWFVYLGTAQTRELRPIDPPPDHTTTSPVTLGAPPT